MRLVRSGANEVKTVAEFYLEVTLLQSFRDFTQGSWRCLPDTDLGHHPWEVAVHNTF